MWTRRGEWVVNLISMWTFYLLCKLILKICLLCSSHLDLNAKIKIQCLCVSFLVKWCLFSIHPHGQRGGGQLNVQVCPLGLDGWPKICPSCFATPHRYKFFSYYNLGTNKWYFYNDNTCINDRNVVSTNIYVEEINFSTCGSNDFNCFDGTW